MADVFDLLQQRQIREARHRAEQVGIETASAQASVARLEERIDRLTLACTAMWSVLRQRTGATDEELVTAVQEIDLRDGVLDGRHSPPPIQCPACRRLSHRRHRFCMYCEAPLPQDPLP